MRRGKLVLVDLAGSESLKKVAAADELEEDARRKQAIGINRVLTHLGAVVNNLNAGHDSASAGFRHSALTMLLKDCLGGRARALLIATIGPEAEWAHDTFMTLTFAQQMMQVRNVEKATFIDASKSTLVQMQQRHLEVMRKLREQSAASDTASSAPGEDWQRLQSEVSELGRRLLTKSSAADALEQMHEERRKKMDELKQEVAQAMAREFAALQEQSNRNIAGLKQVVEEKTKEGVELALRRQRERHEAQVEVLRKDTDAKAHARRGAELEARELRDRIAAAEEEASTAEALQAQVAEDRASLEAERLEQRLEAQERHGKLARLEGECERLRAEAALQLREMERVRAAHSADTAAAEEERAAWSAREAELVEAVGQAAEQLKAQTVHGVNHSGEAAAQKAAELEGLQSAVARLEADRVAQRAELDRALELQARLEEEAEEARVEEEELTAEVEEEIRSLEEETAESQRRAKDVLHMLDDLQRSIMSSHP